MAYTPMELATVFIKTGELEDALDALNQQLTDVPEDHLARRIRISVLMRLLDDAHLHAALQDFDTLPQLTAEDHLNASVIQERLGNLEAAITSAQAASTQEPTNERIIERLLDLHLKAARYEAALAIVRQQERTWRWLEREGDVLVLLGDDVLASARYGLVLAQLEAFADTMRSDYYNALRVRVLLARANVYRRLGNTGVAREHYNEAAAILPDDPTIAFNLGLLLAMEGDTEAALQQCTDAHRAAPPALQQEMLNSLPEHPGYAAIQAVLLADKG